MLYHWDQVEYNRGYAPGDVIVEAETVQEARDAALVFVERAINHKDNWWRDAGERAVLLAQATVDLAQEPDYVNHGVVIIRGSD